MLLMFYDMLQIMIPEHSARRRVCAMLILMFFFQIFQIQFYRGARTPRATTRFTGLRHALPAR